MNFTVKFVLYTCCEKGGSGRLVRPIKMHGLLSGGLLITLVACFTIGSRVAGLPFVY